MSCTPAAFRTGRKARGMPPRRAPARSQSRRRYFTGNHDAAAFRSGIGPVGRVGGPRRPPDQPELRTYLQELEKLRELNRRLPTTPPDSAEYGSTASELGRLNRRLMEQFREASSEES